METSINFISVNFNLYYTLTYFFLFSSLFIVEEKQSVLELNDIGGVSVFENITKLLIKLNLNFLRKLCDL